MTLTTARGAWRRVGYGHHPHTPPADSATAGFVTARPATAPMRPLEVFAWVTTATDVRAASREGAHGIAAPIEALVPAHLGDDTLWALLDVVHAAADLPVVIEGFEVPAEGGLDPRVDTVLAAVVEADLAGLVRCLTIAFDPGDGSAGHVAAVADQLARVHAAVDDLLGPDLAARVRVEVCPSACPRRVRGGPRAVEAAVRAAHASGADRVTYRLGDVARARQLAARPPG